MANIGTIRTRAELFHTALEENTLPGVLRYYSRIVGDAAPAATEVFLNGQEGSRFYLPTNSCISGMLVVSAWNVTDGDNPAGSVVFFSAENDGGTVALFPADFYAGADFTANPVIAYDDGVSGLVATMAADDTNKAVVFNFTATANDTYEVNASLYYSFSSAKLRNPNFYTATN